MPVAYKFDKFDKLHLAVALALNLNRYDWIEVILLHDQLFFFILLQLLKLKAMKDICLEK